MSRIEINDIPRDHKFEGYLWKSNDKAPIILNHEPLPEVFFDDANPFVVEAELWDSDNNKSYALHQAGNQTILQCFEVMPEDFNSHDIDEVVYASHRMNDRELHFLEYWEERVAANGDSRQGACLDMPALVMTRRVFVGFNAKENRV